MHTAPKIAAAPPPLIHIPAAAPHRGAMRASG
jgi:hypothetical protein